MEENTERPPLLDRNIYLIFSITLFAVMGVASITPAFPKIIEAFQIKDKQVGYLISVFSFPGIILTPILGVLADRIGRKKILVPCIIVFGLAGGACALTRDYTTLLILRFFQGTGASALGLLNITLIGDLYSGKRRNAVMGYNAGVLSIGTASFPFFGGLLASVAWFYPFYLPFLAVPMGLVILFLLNNPEPKKKQRLGEYLLATLKSVYNKHAIGLFIINLLTFVVLYGALLTFFPIIMDRRFGASPTIIGVFMAVMSGFTMLASVLNGALSRFLTKKLMLIIAFMLMSGAMIIVPHIEFIWIMLIPTAMYGLAQGMNMPTNQTLLVSAAPMENRGGFMSVNGMVLRLGQFLGPFIMGLFYSFGIQWAFFGGAAISILLILIVIFMIDKNM